MVWLKLIKYVRQELENAGIRTIYGAMDPATQGADEAGYLLIYRGDEAYTYAGVDFRYVNAKFYLECWVRSDEPELMTGCERLEALEEKAWKVLQEINAESGKIGDGLQIMGLGVSRISGDYDTARPLVGSQMEIEATVYEEAEE